MKTLLSIVFVVCAVLTASSSTTTATSSGDWTENSNWDNGAPGCFDTIVIPAGIQIDITSTQDLEGCSPGLDSIIILISGRLEFQNGKKLKLPCDSDVYVGNGGSIGVGSGGGNSTYIETCGTQYWNASGGDLSGPSELCDGGCNTLPIQLVFFEATRNSKDRRTDLSWRTKSETDNDFFTVQRSSNTQSWTTVCVKKGAGNSSGTLNYSAQDYEPFQGVIYYRLKQTDFNGDFAYSPIVSVQNNINSELNVYPNPAYQHEQVIIEFPEVITGDLLVQVFTVDGKEVYFIKESGLESRSYILDTSQLIGSGYYIIKWENQSIPLIINE